MARKSEVELETEEAETELIPPPGSSIRIIPAPATRNLALWGHQKW